MSETARNLPDFTNPPLDEAILGVHFDPLPGFIAPHLGLFWAEIRRQFPNVQEQPTLDPIIERFGEGLPEPVAAFRLMDKPETPRCWYISESENDLFQVQRDRFIRNWRKRREEDVYPRYETIRDSFRAEFERFVGFAQREGIGDVKPSQCEVTYLNHITPGVWERKGQFERVFRLWKRPSGGVLPEPEEVRFRIRYVITNDAGEPVGRLHAIAHPAMRKKDGVVIIVLELTARGAPLSRDVEGVLRFMDLGRDWIVRAFAELTRPEMHKAWGRTDG